VRLSLKSSFGKPLPVVFFGITLLLGLEWAFLQLANLDSPQLDPGVSAFNGGFSGGGFGGGGGRVLATVTLPQGAACGALCEFLLWLAEQGVQSAAGSPASDWGLGDSCGGDVCGGGGGGGFGGDGDDPDSNVPGGTGGGSSQPPSNNKGGKTGGRK
jgi:hypothetical protein